MGDIMTPIPFDRIMDRLFDEMAKEGSCFGVKKAYKADKNKFYTIFGRKLETQIGPAAGPHTQLAQNIIAGYYAGARFFELKTVQKMDGRELAACVAKPCITAEDECYNCEWSTELTVQEAFDEYIKGWFALKVISKEWGLGGSDGFQFNISVGYDLEGIKLPKVDNFINGMMDASETPIYKECKEYLEKNLGKFEHFTKADLDAITPDIVNSATVSTLHGCPPQEIEAIASYLITEKGLNTFVKCNPTLLGYEVAREMLDSMGYDYIAFTDLHFKEDLQYSDAVPMLERLMALASSKNLEFGVKITNTFPVDVKNNELPSQEMYMSGKSLYPLSMLVARNLSRSFNGKLRIAYSGGCDYFNIDKVIDSGIWPVTVATTILKPGGYQRFIEMSEKLEKPEIKAWSGIDVEALEKLVSEVRTDKHHVKPVKPLPNRKADKKVPYLDCYMAPCVNRCPINQDITTYGILVNEGRYDDALNVILEKNPLPFMTGHICTHTCQSACTRNHYETDVQIRRNKLIAAQNAFEKVVPTLKSADKKNLKVAVVGGGPAGIAAAFFLAREGVDVTVFDERDTMGGVVANIIPGFRIPADDIQRDVELAKAYGAKFVTNKRIDDINALKAEGFDKVILAIGAHKELPLELEEGKAINALHFLEDFKKTEGKMDLGENVIVVGGGNTAMDVARAAKRVPGVKNVYLAYRRNARYMPADEEELNEAIEDGVEFVTLVSPKSFKGGKLVCAKNVLGEPDASGRRGVKETDELVELPCDTLIASIGESVRGDFYTSNGIEIDKKNLPVLDPVTLETNVKGVYAAGDGAKGASVIVKAIADSKKVCEAIVNHAIGELKISDTTDEKVYDYRGTLEEPVEKKADDRCLACDYICENCTEVCPNRANVYVNVKGKHQIVHVDYMCNECGNCETFCPYASAPYKDKLTLFASEADMLDSKNDGFVITRGCKDVKVRIDGQELVYRIGESNDKLNYRYAELIDTIYNEYDYLLLK